MPHGHPVWERLAPPRDKPWIVVASGATIETAFLPNRLLDLQVDFEITVTAALSPAALDFVAPIPLAAITGGPVYHDNAQLDAASGAPLHAVLCEADLLVVYPASARMIAQCALGIVECAPTRLFAFMDKSKIVVAPALHPVMDRRLYDPHFETLRSLGCELLPTTDGLVCWADVVKHVEARLSLKRQTLAPEVVLLNRLHNRVR